MKSVASIAGIVLLSLAGCMNASPRMNSPWRVQRVPPTWSPSVPAWRPASPQPVTPTPNKPTAPNNSAQPGSKLVPTPTPDPQFNRPKTYADETPGPSAKETNPSTNGAEPQIRFKLPSGSEPASPKSSGATPSNGAEGIPTLELPGIETDPAPPTNNRPSPLGPKFGGEKSASHSQGKAPLSDLRFEALPPPTESNKGAALQRPLKLKVVSQRKRPVGGTVTYDVLVQNDGPQPVEQAVVLVDFDKPLTFPGHRERQLRKNLGRLAPGQSREMRLSLLCLAVGSFDCRFELLADGVEAQRHVASVEFVEPKLQLELLGPARRTVGSRAEFSIKVANVSQQPIDDLMLSVTHDAALTPREATGGYQLEQDRLSWKLGRLEAGEGRQVRAEFDCRQIAEQACVTVEARSAELATDLEEKCVTVVAIPGELDLRLSDRTDPVKVGDEVPYEITLQNLGLQPIESVQLELQTSEHLRLDSHTAQIGNRTVSMTKTDRLGRWLLQLSEPLAADATLRLEVRAKALSAGDSEMRVVATPPGGIAVETLEFTTVNH